MMMVAVVSDYHQLVRTKEMRMRLEDLSDYQPQLVAHVVAVVVPVQGFG
jgi:hypothetical protein